MPAEECTHGDEKLTIYFTWPKDKLVCELLLSVVVQFSRNAGSKLGYNNKAWV